MNVFEDRGEIYIRQIEGMKAGLNAKLDYLREGQGEDGHEMAYTGICAELCLTIGANILEMEVEDLEFWCEPDIQVRDYVIPGALGFSGIFYCNGRVTKIVRVERMFSELFVE